jgi:hypothetical protein
MDTTSQQEMGTSSIPRKTDSLHHKHPIHSISISLSTGDQTQSKNALHVASRYTMIVYTDTNTFDLRAGTATARTSLRCKSAIYVDRTSYVMEQDCKSTTACNTKGYTHQQCTVYNSNITNDTLQLYPVIIVKAVTDRSLLRRQAHAVHTQVTYSTHVIQFHQHDDKQSRMAR